VKLLPLVLLIALAPWTLCAQEATPSPATKKAAPKADPAVRAFLKEWAASMKDVKTLRVRFKQTKKLRILKRPLVRSGETLLKGRHVLMTVLGKDGKPEIELLVIPGEARLHYPRLKRLEVFKLGEGRTPPTPFPLFGTDLETLPQRYRLSLSQGKDKEKGQRTLVMIPRAKGAPIQETRMVFRGTTIVRIEQKNRRGDRVIIVVERFERNPKIERSLELKPAPGTQISHPTTGS
jgi:hypothetical protein